MRVPTGGGEGEVCVATIVSLGVVVGDEKGEGRPQRACREVRNDLRGTAERGRKGAVL